MKKHKLFYYQLNIYDILEKFETTLRKVDKLSFTRQLFHAYENITRRQLLTQYISSKLLLKKKLDKANPYTKYQRIIKEYYATLVTALNILCKKHESKVKVVILPKEYHRSFMAFNRVNI